MNGIVKPSEYDIKSITALVNVSSIAAKAKIDPKIGPIQGVQPKPKAKPIINGKIKLSDFWASNLFSKLRKLKFKKPKSCNEKIIIIIPAKTLRIWEFAKRIFPRKDAVAPKIIKTVEKPKQNKIKGNNLTFLSDSISLKDCPDTNDI